MTLPSIKPNLNILTYEEDYNYQLYEEDQSYDKRTGRTHRRVERRALFCFAEVTIIMHQDNSVFFKPFSFVFPSLAKQIQTDTKKCCGREKLFFVVERLLVWQCFNVPLDYIK